MCSTECSRRSGANDSPGGPLGDRGTIEKYMRSFTHKTNKPALACVAPSSKHSTAPVPDDPPPPPPPPYVPTAKYSATFIAMVANISIICGDWSARKADRDRWSAMEEERSIRAPTRSAASRSCQHAGKRCPHHSAAHTRARAHTHTHTHAHAHAHAHAHTKNNRSRKINQEDGSPTRKEYGTHHAHLVHAWWWMTAKHSALSSMHDQVLRCQIVGEQHELFNELV